MSYLLRRLHLAGASRVSASHSDLVFKSTYFIRKKEVFLIQTCTNKHRCHGKLTGLELRYFARFKLDLV